MSLCECVYVNGEFFLGWCNIVLKICEFAIIKIKRGFFFFNVVHIDVFVNSCVVLPRLLGNDQKLFF